MNETAMNVSQSFQAPQAGSQMHALLDASELNEGFWRHYLRAITEVTQCHIALILVRSSDANAWQALSKYPQRQDDLTPYAESLLQTAERVTLANTSETELLANSHQVQMHPLLDPTTGVEPVVLALIFVADPAPLNGAAGTLKQLLLGLPKHIQKMRQTAELDLSRVLTDASLIALTQEICQQDHFLKSAFHLCNALVNQLHCERVSLGVLRGRRIRLTAVSQSANFDRRSAVARDIVDAMEEAVDQQQIIQYPSEDSGRRVNRAHRLFAETHGQRTVLTVPFEGLQGSFGALFIEYREHSPNPADLESLRRFLNALGPFLERSHLASRLFTVRYWHQFMTAMRWLLGPRNIGGKLAGLTAACVLATVFLVEIDYRVDAKATIRSEDLAIIPAPFDGYLATVHADLGDQVSPGDTLLSLDTRELRQEETIASADVVRYQREIEKALAAREFATMQIARAQLAQAEAKLALVTFRLNNASVKAPRAGIIVEGDLRKDLGSPVRQGDPLLKLASTETIYLELEVNQGDVHLLEEGFEGEVALVGRPDQRVPFVIERIDPVAQTRDVANIFIAKASIQADRESWWRPGMGGTAKITSGPQTLIWIMTHRTLNFMRNFFWL